MGSHEKRSSDFSAGDFRARVAGGRSLEVVGRRMDNHGFTDDVLEMETVGQKDRDGDPARAEERRQIARVVGVRALHRIEVCTRVREGVLRVARAACARMNVESENRLLAFVAFRGEPDHGRPNENARVRLIERHLAPNVGVEIVPRNPRPCLRSAAKDRQEMRGIIPVIHNSASPYFLQ